MVFFSLRGRKKIVKKHSHIGIPVLSIFLLSILSKLRTLIGDGLGGGKTDWTEEEDVGRR
jgi:hypothetical protein